MNEASNDKPTNNMIKIIEPILEKTAGFSSRFGFHFASTLGSILHDLVDVGYTLGGVWDHLTVRKGAFVHFVDFVHFTVIYRFFSFTATIAFTCGGR